MRALVLIGIILSLIGCANLTPEQKQARRDAREYRDQEYYLTVYLPKKAACKGVWVVVSKGTEVTRHKRKRMTMSQMRGAYCARSMNDILW